MDKYFVAQGRIEFAILAGQVANVADFINRLCRSLLLAAAAGDFDKCASGIDAHNPPARSNHGMQAGMRRGITASSLQNRAA